MTSVWGGRFVAAIVGVAITGVVAYVLNQDLIASQQQATQQLQVAQAELTQVELDNQRLTTQLSLDQATQQALEQRLADKQDELATLNEQLAFYEHLLPVGEDGTVQVRALDLQEKDDYLVEYKLLLQRSADLPRFEGHILFKARGQQDGKSVTIQLYPAGTDEPSASAAEITIDFDQFLRTTGLLLLPQNLEPEAISVYIYQGSQLRATHKVDIR